MPTISEFMEELKSPAARQTMDERVARLQNYPASFQQIPQHWINVHARQTLAFHPDGDMMQMHIKANWQSENA